MNETQMWLTDAEIAIVLKDREKKAYYKALREKQRDCQHNWVYAGYGGGESMYECSICKDTKWE